MDTGRVAQAVSDRATNMTNKRIRLLHYCSFAEFTSYKNILSMRWLEPNRMNCSRSTACFLLLPFPTSSNSVQTRSPTVLFVRHYLTGCDLGWIWEQRS